MEFKHKIVDELGVHARPASMLVNEAKKYKSEIIIRKDNKMANARIIFQLLSMALKYGDEVIIEVNGEDEIFASEKLKEFCSLYL